MVTILANCGAATGGFEAYSMGAITVMKTYYNLNLTFFAAFLIVVTAQVYVSMYVLTSYCMFFYKKKQKALMLKVEISRITSPKL